MRAPVSRFRDDVPRLLTRPAIPRDLRLACRLIHESGCGLLEPMFRGGDLAVRLARAPGRAGLGGCVMAELEGRPVALAMAYPAEEGAGAAPFRARGPTADALAALFERSRREGSWYLAALAVLPEVRRRGIASALLARALENGRAAGRPTASLHVLTGNTPARALYAAAGFVEAGCEALPEDVRTRTAGPLLLLVRESPSVSKS